jgi:hypothetical protein
MKIFLLSNLFSTLVLLSSIHCVDPHRGLMNRRIDIAMTPLLEKRYSHIRSEFDLVKLESFRTDLRKPNFVYKGLAFFTTPFDPGCLFPKILVRRERIKIVSISQSFNVFIHTPMPVQK